MTAGILFGLIPLSRALAPIGHSAEKRWKEQSWRDERRSERLSCLRGCAVVVLLVGPGCYAEFYLASASELRE